MSKKSAHSLSLKSQIIPLVKLGPSPPSVANACYFYGGYDDGEHRFLSYHYKEQAETIEFDQLADEAINFLSGDS